MPLVSRTRATLRSAEFGFFGVCVNTRTQTPRFCGLLCSAGLFVLVRTASRPCRTNWLIVGIGNHTSHAARLGDDAPNTTPSHCGVAPSVVSGLGAEARRPKQSPIAAYSVAIGVCSVLETPRQSRGNTRRRELFRVKRPCCRRSSPGTEL